VPRGAAWHQQRRLGTYHAQAVPRQTRALLVSHNRDLTDWSLSTAFGVTVRLAYIVRRQFRGGQSRRQTQRRQERSACRALVCMTMNVSSPVETNSVSKHSYKHNALIADVLFFFKKKFPESPVKVSWRSCSMVEETVWVSLEHLQFNLQWRSEVVSHWLHAVFHTGTLSQMSTVVVECLDRGEKGGMGEGDIPRKRSISKVNNRSYTSNLKQTSI
jgi:hypothetical protein